MAAATQFVILTAPRTGSTWLVDTLNNHPSIAAYSELFLPRPRGRKSAYGSHEMPYFTHYGDNGSSPRTGIGLLRKRITYLNELYGRNEADSVGFKLSYKQAKLNPGVLTYLSLRRARVVHVIRSNVLDSVISWQTAIARNFLHAREGDEVEPVRVELEAETLLERLDHHEYAITLARGWIRNLHLPYTEAFYEELTGPRQEEKLARILNFLGVEPDGEALDSNLVRMNPTDQRKTIANYDEIRNTLAGSRFEWMLR